MSQRLRDFIVTYLVNAIINLEAQGEFVENTAERNEEMKERDEENHDRRIV